MSLKDFLKASVGFLIGVVFMAIVWSNSETHQEAMERKRMEMEYIARIAPLVFQKNYCIEGEQMRFILNDLRRMN